MSGRADARANKSSHCRASRSQSVVDGPIRLAGRHEHRRAVAAGDGDRKEAFAFLRGVEDVGRDLPGGRAVEESEGVGVSPASRT